MPSLIKSVRDFSIPLFRHFTDPEQIEAFRRFRNGESADFKSDGLPKFKFAIRLFKIYPIFITIIYGVFILTHLGSLKNHTPHISLFTDLSSEEISSAIAWVTMGLTFVAFPLIFVISERRKITDDFTSIETKKSNSCDAYVTEWVNYTRVLILLLMTLLALGVGMSIIAFITVFRIFFGTSLWVSIGSTAIFLPFLYLSLICPMFAAYIIVDHEI